MRSDAEMPTGGSQCPVADHARITSPGPEAPQRYSGSVEEVLRRSGGCNPSPYGAREIAVLLESCNARGRRLARVSLTISTQHVRTKRPSDGMVLDLMTSSTARASKVSDVGPPAWDRPPEFGQPTPVRALGTTQKRLQPPSGTAVISARTLTRRWPLWRSRPPVRPGVRAAGCGRRRR